MLLFTIKATVNLDNTIFWGFLEQQSSEGWVFLSVCAVSAQPGQDEFLNTQKHPGSSRTTQTADGVQSSQTGNFIHSLLFVFSLVLCFNPHPNLIFPDPAPAILTEFQPGSGHAARERRVHRLWGHPQWWDSCTVLSNIDSAVRTWNGHVTVSVCYISDPAQSEMMGEPHMMVEYKLGLLWKKADFILLFVCIDWFIW